MSSCPFFKNGRSLGSRPIRPSDSGSNSSRAVGLAPRGRGHSCSSRPHRRRGGSGVGRARARPTLRSLLSAPSSLTATLPSFLRLLQDGRGGGHGGAARSRQESGHERRATSILNPRRRLGRPSRHPSHGRETPPRGPTEFTAWLLGCRAIIITLRGSNNRHRCRESERHSSRGGRRGRRGDTLRFQESLGPLPAKHTRTTRPALDGTPSLSRVRGEVTIHAPNSTVALDELVGIQHNPRHRGRGLRGPRLGLGWVPELRAKHLRASPRNKLSIRYSL